ncbi:MAG: YafY family transcriptional regulator [Spirochaetes bacterium]|nr:YafY family transcriptional regulator [Spirochaetota bacterium]
MKKNTRSNEQKVITKRLFVIDEMIRSGTYPSIKELAILTEVTPRTIQRDIEYMRDMLSAPIEYSYLHRGYLYSQPNYYLKSVPLTEGELFSIALFDRLLEDYRNTPLEDSLRKIFLKIERSLPENAKADSGFLTKQMTFIPGHAGIIDRETFQTVFTALKTKHTVSFDYRPLKKSGYTRRTVNPYHAVAQNGNWYIIGLCHEKGEPRLFSLSRMKSAVLTENSFVIPAGFKANDYIDPNVGVWVSRTSYKIELLVDNEIGVYALERRWHEDQEVEQREDGVYVRFTTTQMPEVLRWVLGQGHTVKALGPAELVEMVKAELEKMKKIYDIR